MRAGQAVRYLLRTLQALIDTLTLLVVVGLACAGFYALWDSAQLDASARSARWASLRPEEDGQDAAFAKLQATNPDVCGWIQIYGTEIDQPVCFSQDAKRYLSHDAEGSYATAGALFMTAPSQRDFSGARSIIFGHHMDGGAMFGQLGSFKDEEFFEHHRSGRLWSGASWEGVELLGVLSCNAFDDQVYGGNPTDARAYALTLLRRAQPCRTLFKTRGRRVLLLSTCSSDGTDERCVVLALVGGSPQKNPFGQRSSSSVFVPPGGFSVLEGPLYAALFFFGMALVLALALRSLKRRKGRRPA